MPGGCLSPHRVRNGEACSQQLTKQGGNARPIHSKLAVKAAGMGPLLYITSTQQQGCNAITECFHAELHWLSRAAESPRPVRTGALVKDPYAKP